MLPNLFQKSKDAAQQRQERSRRLKQSLAQHPAQVTPVPDGQPRHPIDYLLLYLVALLTLVGVISILTASAHVAQAQLGDAIYYFRKQLFGVVVGAVAMTVAARINLYQLARWIKPLMILTIVLLVCTHIPGLGVTAKGSSRWLNIPGISFQPSEIAKPMLVLYLAAILGNARFALLSLKDKLWAFMPVFAIMFIVLRQPDLGTTIVLGTTVLMICFVAGLPYRYVASIILFGLAGAGLLSWSTPYQQARITSWLDPWSDPQNTGFHLIQSMIAIGSGGVTGKGFGQSVQKLFYLPEQHTDFIFAVIAEEFGLIGCLVLFFLFCALTQRGVSIAFRSQTPYLKLLAIGLATMISMQALVNLGVVTGTIPTTGLTLPFISFGSSSLVVNLAAMGLLLNVSRYLPVRRENIRPTGRQERVS